MIPDMPRPLLLTIDDVAEWLCVSTKHVRNLLRAGELSGVNIGTAVRATWRFEVAEIERFIDTRRTSGKSTTPLRSSGKFGTDFVIDFAQLRHDRKTAKNVSVTGRKLPRKGK